MPTLQITSASIRSPTFFINFNENKIVICTGINLEKAYSLETRNRHQV